MSAVFPKEHHTFWGSQFLLPLETQRLARGVWRTEKGWIAWVGQDNKGILICDRRVIPMKWDDFGRSLTKSRTHRGKWGVKSWKLKDHFEPPSQCPIEKIFTYQNYKQDLESVLF